MRIDKYLSECGYSRKNAIELISKGHVKVNGFIILKKDFKVDEKLDTVSVYNKDIIYNKYIYIMLNKPLGIITATEDKSQKTVLDLLPKEITSKNVFPVGRLDKDTCGLLLITNDGNFCHKLISPKHCVNKIYRFGLCDKISECGINLIQNGITLRDGYTTLPCRIEMIDDKNGLITITEGKYHQIRRMFGAVGNKVCFLERISEGNIKLDPKLERGQYRFLTGTEITCF